MATVTGHPLLLTRADRPVNNACDAKISIHHSVAVAFLFGARRGMIVMIEHGRAGGGDLAFWTFMALLFGFVATTLAGMVGGQLRDAEGRLA
jgi:hypothetical protein